jgi:hypothetical protein
LENDDIPLDSWYAEGIDLFKYLSYTPFFGAGAANVIWALPMVKKWSMPWYVIGIGGIIVLGSIWGYPECLAI